MISSKLKLFTLILAIFCVLLTNVKTYAQNTWQQELEYHINVSLDDKNHELRGNIRIQYKNNSDVALKEIWMHVWPNAYKNDKTAFAIQQLENKSTEFHFSEDSIRGYIDSLDFKVNDVSVLSLESNDFPDIVKLILPSELKSGEQIIISTPFKVKLPNSFSRLGHVGQSYQISQWYPKPAVFDQKGWHPIPYLDQGEFYSEFANYDVKITLPENYVVGSTGELQNETEILFLDSISIATRNKKEYSKKDSFPASSTRLKTLHYRQDKVHDFAWFADKRYNVLASEIELPESKRKVKTYVMFLNSNSNVWKVADTFINNAVYFYSLWNGEYPYKYCTAVDGALSAGGGMEYPMVTVIGETNSKKSLDRVIAHEVGHNWFYGIIGSNEREHGWMDEGINSFYEQRYMRVRYGEHTMVSKKKQNGLTTVFGLNYFPIDYEQYLTYEFTASQGKSQAIETNSEEFTQINYAAVMYIKTSLVLKYLEQYLGVNVFDTVMHNYFEKYKFKHPYPEDLKAEFENYTKENLDWFFYSLINSTVDPNFRIKEIKKENNQYRVKIANNTTTPAPLFISSLNKKGEILETLKTAPYVGSIFLYFDDKDVAKFVIDPLYVIPESNRNDNTMRTTGLLKKVEPLRLQLLAGITRPDRTNLFYTPTLGYNVNDGFQTGIAFYNNVFPFKKTEWLVMPMYGFESKKLNGAGVISQYFYPTKFEQIKISASINSFSNTYINSEINNFTIYERFIKTAIESEFTLKKHTERSRLSRKLSYRIVSVNKLDKNLYNQLRYIKKNSKTINPSDLNILLEIKSGNVSNPNHLKLFASYKYKFNYAKSKKGVEIRAFAGTVLTKTFSTNKSDFFSLSGNNDYTFDKAFFDRYNVNRNQFHELDGAFKSNTFMGTVKSLAGLNLKAPAKFKFPVGIFADAGYSSIDNKMNNLKFNFDAGIYVPIVADIFEIYIPLVYDTNGINTASKAELIRFVLDFQAIEPFKLRRNLQLF